MISQLNVGQLIQISVVFLALAFIQYIPENSGL